MCKHYLVLLISCFLSFNLVAQPEGIITVKGTARTKAQPDLAYLRMNLQVKADEYNTTARKLEQDYQALENYFSASLGEAPDLQTSSYQIQEYSRYIEGERKMIGYSGSHRMTLAFQNDPAIIGNMVNLLRDSPVPVRFEFVFNFSEEKKAAIKTRLIEKALDDAKLRARSLAEASGTKLGRVRSIDYGISKSEDQYRYNEDNLLEEIPATRQQNMTGAGFKAANVYFDEQLIVVYELLHSSPK
jgi:hypothetical protein